MAVQHTPGIRTAAAARKQSPASAGEAPPKLSELGLDLVAVSRYQQVRAVVLPLLCAAAYIVCGLAGWWPAAVAALVGVSFVTYGSISHDLVHGNLGFPRRLNDALLCAVELLALRSGHAYQAAHLYHHARFPHEDDVEGAAARMSLWRTPLEGVVFSARIYAWALRRAPRRRVWILAEGAACAGFVAAALALWPLTCLPTVYVVLMIMGSWIIPLITSYLPHDAEGADALHQTRAFRGRVMSAIAMEHMYHLEHHLYPAVPRHNWPHLARRLDPYLKAAGIEPIRLWF